MKVMVIVRATKSSEAGEMPSEQLLTEMGNFNEELSKAGIFLAAEGLHPSSNGARIRFSGKDRTVTDGPFTETKELIAGFWLWKVSSMQEAIDWVTRCPNPMTEDSDIEIRQVFEFDDFGEALTPELREQEERVQTEVAERNNNAQGIPASKDEDEIRSLAKAWSGSLESKDVDAMLTGYSEDILLYDVKPPYRLKGLEAYRANWEACLPYFPAKMKSEHRDFTVTVDGDVAFAHGLHHVVPIDEESPVGQTWLRITIGYQRTEGEWRVMHEHVSVPFDPMTEKVSYITDEVIAETI
ncbi:SgcJ/EcaC family oxidoreductase [Gimesia aquarii]|uniref:YCII-related domain protein n=1 Tax=Gimesia aquarii TaxID=2527964 RepID=A0A517W0M3_9PLAN|nr:SgcJ/EcaC family oxidoreductase [Gimesia aquarii]QDT98790.1 YCII-related domain protein [Gimesia aquarii]